MSVKIREAEHARLGGRTSGIEQAEENRVWCTWRGSKLRLEQRGHEEWMVDTLDGPDLAGGRNLPVPSSLAYERRGARRGDPV